MTTATATTETVTNAISEADQAKFANLLALLNGPQKSFEREKADFLAKLDKDPVTALEWSTGLMNLAAKVEVYGYWAKQIEDNQSADLDGGTVLTYDAGVTFIKETLQRSVLQLAKNPRHSSSITANYMDAAKLAASATLLEQLTIGRSFI